MKTILLITVFSLCTLVSSSQWTYTHSTTKKHYLYSTGEYVVGEKQAGNIGLSYNYNNKYTLSLGYSATFKSFVSPPDAFLKSGTNLTLANPDKPFENTESLHLMVGRIFDLNEKGNLRVVLQGGPGIATSREPEFNLTPSGDQYYFETKASKKMSLVLNPKIEMPLFYSVGCSVGPMIVLDSNQTYIGAGIGIIYGLIKHN